MSHLSLQFINLFWHSYLSIFSKILPLAVKLQRTTRISVEEKYLKKLQIFLEMLKYKWKVFRRIINNHQWNVVYKHRSILIYLVSPARLNESCGRHFLHIRVCCPEICVTANCSWKTSSCWESNLLNIHCLFVGWLIVHIYLFTWEHEPWPQTGCFTMQIN